MCYLGLLCFVFNLRSFQFPIRCVHLYLCYPLQPSVFTMHWKTTRLWKQFPNSRPWLWVVLQKRFHCRKLTVRRQTKGSTITDYMRTTMIILWGSWWYARITKTIWQKDLWLQQHTNLLSATSSHSHFLQAGTHFAKLKHALRQYIVDTATISAVNSSYQVHVLDDLHENFLEELLDMHSEVWKNTRNTNTTLHGNTENANISNRFKKNLTAFRRMWNTDGLGHVCIRIGPEASWCCQDDKDAKQKMANTLIQLAVSAVPETPAPGKWTKLWSCLQLPSCQ